jgi:hypothetical protein
MTAVRRALACLSVVILTACSGGGSSSASPQTLVSQAKATLDATSGVHFVLTSANAPISGTVLVGGTGDAGRDPTGFIGKLQVQRSGLLLSIDVLSSNGTVLIRPPLTTKFSPADPHAYGFSDPGKLLDPQTGISKLLAELSSVKAAGRDRFHGEKVTEVDVTLPGAAVKSVLTSADPAQPVRGRLSINASNHELRRAVLTGPFLKKGLDTTFTIVLDHYGERPDIRVAG